MQQRLTRGSRDGPLNRGIEAQENTRYSRDGPLNQEHSYTIRPTVWFPGGTISFGVIRDAVNRALPVHFVVQAPAGPNRARDMERYFRQRLLERHLAGYPQLAQEISWSLRLGNGIFGFDVQPDTLMASGRDNRTIAGVLQNALEEFAAAH